MKAIARSIVAAGVACACAIPAAAQESKSAPLVKQLAAALDAAHLDSIATKDPSSPDVFIGALYFPGLQLLAVSGKYSAPSLLETRLGKKEYRDVYIDLFGAAVADSKVFVEDIGTNGLLARPGDDGPGDGFELAAKRTAFDGEWGDQQLSEEEYLKIYTAADERYAHMLSALLAAVRKSS